MTVLTLFSVDSSERDVIERRFGARFAAAVFTPRYNAAPYQSQQSFSILSRRSFNHWCGDCGRGG